MLLYHSPVFALHDTRNHPESVARIVQVNAMLKEKGWLEKCAQPTWKPADNSQCVRVHTETYIKNLERWCNDNAGRVEVDTVVSKGSWQAATMAAGAVCDAVQRVIQGDDPVAFCAIRPPGHHALPDAPMGFCLLNNVAIGAMHARALGLNHVLIVDWDVHHGNGTQDTFWNDPTVGFVSIHRFPFYPGTGKADETGGSKASGTKVNLPVPAGTPPEEFLNRLIDATEKLANNLKPELILLSAGFDAHAADPVGGLTLEAEHFLKASQWISQLAKQHCGGKLVALLEGGYHLKHMPECVDAHLSGLLEANGR